MPHLIYGTTKCPICGQVITKEDAIIGFNPFVVDRQSPLRIFSDAILHKDCFVAHPLSDEALTLYDSIYHQENQQENN